VVAKRARLDPVQKAAFAGIADGRVNGQAYSMVTSRRSGRLPKAPLAEVVFELRWALQEGPEGEAILRSDPGLLPLLAAFTDRMRKLGFRTAKDMSHPLQTGAYGVVRRYYKSADRPFPIMQVGNGIFASNDSSSYVWPAFKKQVNQGLRVLLAAYPKLDFFSIVPNHIELRYIDLFTASLAGRTKLFEFIEQGTTLKIDFPTFLNNKKIFSGDPVGRFGFRRPLKFQKNSNFLLDLASIRQGDSKEDAIRMESKVVTTGDSTPSTAEGTARFLKHVDDWLESAHAITSPFFREFILPEMMNKFKG
jgi:uncharacterized protein (TIGR04255 family)